MSRLVSIVVLLTWGLLGLNALSGICFGSDGHAGLESMVVPHQKPSAAAAEWRHEPSDGAVVSKQRVHGPCVDVPLEQVSGTQIRGGKSYSPEVAKVQAAEAPLMPLPVSLVSATSDSDHGLVEAVGEITLFRSARSTILRI